MMVIPTGRFLMGSPDDELGRHDNEGSQHVIRIENLFALGVYSVTFDEYDQFCKNTQREKPDDKDWGRGDRPVINVTWHDAQAYCKWLSKLTKQYYRLPSEAEWEYACRAGTQTPFYTGKTINSDQANFAGNHGQTLPVGSFPPNSLGLYDMHGNIWEWTQDCWHGHYDHAPDDGSAWQDENGGDCRLRVVRGGSWLNKPQLLRSAKRNWVLAGRTNISLGFRIARVF
ncbi:formylglycine-generating enzyme family protein [Nitrosomonas sp. Is35]|uniref:formylglycine-generating enzyme family protein n=1 Tax=Nitrosomonas sp. Is35 TaxID=3080534 RepID=UPI00294B0D4F|nr:formylglycine-generating enzyme family protein [Nitrosomonas sp. Is35]MDV6348283.1 formylglycine-generating enzyme family protein [Nitrosomonas sp. Is35]